MERNSPIIVSLIVTLTFISGSLSAQNTYLTTVNNSNCNFGIIAPLNLPGIGNFNCHAYDKYHHRYFLSFTEYQSGIQHLLTIEASSGNILNDKLVSSLKNYQLLQNICYDLQTDRLYGLVNDRVAMESYFVSLDPGSGSITTLNKIGSVPHNQFYATINSTTILTRLSVLNIIMALFMKPVLQSSAALLTLSGFIHWTLIQEQ